ncbi:amidase [Propionicicella superfundia]|uniref:amidase n=1 Tax=Propionicicella superfundia TaxID=348582 RepID=UPI00040A858F|nr:amidase [Propionicicella superfundia]
MDYTEFDALSLGAAIASGDASPVEVTESALALAAERGPAVGAFAHLTPEYAMGQARAAADRLARRSDLDLPLLFGVPCPVKDLTRVAGLPWEAGSRALAGNVADVDDGVVTRLRDAGTIMIGKTATPEFGFPCYTEPDSGPAARTPWDLSRSAGGSSGGAAAAVAAGIVPIAHGSDGGGSIRIPAAVCGLVGLKASRGRISPGPFRVEGPGLGSDGVLTRTVRDTAAALDALAGPLPGDQYVAPAPRTSFLKSCQHLPAGLRIGVLTTPVVTADATVHPAALRAVEALIPVLVDLGCEVSQAPPPFLPEQWDVFRAIWAVDATQLPVSAAQLDLCVPLTRWLRERGAAVSGAEYAAALTDMQRLTRDVARTWAGFDAVLTPTLAGPPALVGGLRDDADPAADFEAQTRFTPWTSIANLTGRPSISLPTHREVVGGVELPFGTMLTGTWGSEPTLLALAAALEEAIAWPRPSGIRAA